MNLCEYLKRERIVPVAEVEAVGQAVDLGRALIAAGLGCVEITFRTAAAAEAIAAITGSVPELTVGAGTVRTVDQVDTAIEAGARFLVAPGLNPVVVERAKAQGVPMLPGVCTPTEIEQAESLGFQLLKFFPAEASGGVAFLKALAGPYPDVAFVPTGSIGPSNLASYLALRNVVACAGSWMVPTGLIAQSDFASITDLAAQARALAAAVGESEST